MNSPDGPVDASSTGGIALARGVRMPDGAYRFQFARSAGPGGQNVNKLNTKAELWVRLEGLLGLSPEAVDRLRQIAGKRLTNVGEIHLSADASRSQEQNRQAVLQRLAIMVAAAMHEPKKRRKTKPTRSSRQRRLEGKRHRGQIKAQRKSGCEQD